MKKVIAIASLALFLGGMSVNSFAQDGEKKEKQEQKKCDKKKCCKKKCDKKKAA